MKRSALILLTAIYIISCMGMSINRFYCCGQLASVTYGIGAGEDGNKAAKKDKCCDHQNQSFKVKDSHFSTVSLSLNHPSPVIVPSFKGIANEAFISILAPPIFYRGNAPPGYSAISIYTLNCAFRI